MSRIWQHDRRPLEDGKQGEAQAHKFPKIAYTFSAYDYDVETVIGLFLDLSHCEKMESLARERFIPTTRCIEWKDFDDKYWIRLAVMDKEKELKKFLLNTRNPKLHHFRDEWSQQRKNEREREQREERRQRERRP